MNKTTFGKDFLWGTATASYQVEGAHDRDGRTFSVWDTFSRKPGAVLHGHTGDNGSFQYDRFKEDVKLMADIGIQSYRFSLSWPRIFPENMKTQNPKGFDYYNALVDELLAHNIKPCVTLYHWDLPQYIEDQGGWPERNTTLLFSDYAEACYKALADRVEMWGTINEPICPTIYSYETGGHAPGRTNRADAYRAVHHVLLAHGMAVKVFRDNGYNGKIGIVLNLETPVPATQREEDILAADRAADKQSRLFIDPVFGRGYPERHLAAYPEIDIPIKDGDMDLIAQETDYLGMNYYFENCAAYDPIHPEGFRYVKRSYKTTDMGWYIVPKGLYRQLLWVHQNYGPKSIYITENGCAVKDSLEESAVEERELHPGIPESACRDRERIAYLQGHFQACADAIKAGVPLHGYYLWSFIDNFEWAYGYTKRFGIVYCDYLNGRRIPKDSYYYYREVIGGYETF